MYILKPNKQRGQVAIGFSAVVVAMCIAEIVVYLWQYYLIDAFRNGSVGMDDLNVSDIVIRIVAITGLVFFLVSNIVFILWFRRAYYNIHELSPVALKYADSMAVGGWFIPVGNFFIPFQIMKDIWRSTMNVLGGNTKFPHPAALIFVWWLCYILYCLNGYIAPITASLLSNDPADKYKYQVLLLAIGSMIGVFSFIAQIVLIRKYALLEIEMQQTIEQSEDSIFAINPTAYME